MFQNKFKKLLIILRRRKLLISSLGVLGFISFLTMAGGLLGYSLAKWSSGEWTGRAGRIKSLRFKIGRYRFHFHHWLAGFILFFLGVFDILPLFKEALFQGAAIGIVFQGIFNYSDWYRIVQKAW